MHLTLLKLDLSLSKDTLKRERKKKKKKQVTDWEVIVAKPNESISKTQTSFTSQKDNL